jgi:hypothetical protein
MVSAYVLVSVEPGKNQDVVLHCDRLPVPTPSGASPTSSRISRSTTTVHGRPRARDDSRHPGRPDDRTHLVAPV